MKKSVLIFVLTAQMIGLQMAKAANAAGDIIVEDATHVENMINLKITGPAADKISEQLEKNGVTFRRDGFSGTLVQYADGVRCIKAHSDGLYCSISITEKTVK